MILLDTLAWIEHLQAGSTPVTHLLDNGQVPGHPSVVGELAPGRLRRRDEDLGLIGRLPWTTCATETEERALIERHELWEVV